MVIDDTMPIDKVIKLGKLVKGICSQDDSTRIDSLSLYEVSVVIKGRYTTTLRIEYDTVDTVTVRYVYMYDTITDLGLIEYSKRKTYKLSDDDVLGKILNECQQLILLDDYYDQVELLKERLDNEFSKAVRKAGYMN